MATPSIISRRYTDLTQCRFGRIHWRGLLANLISPYRDEREMGSRSIRGDTNREVPVHPELVPMYVHAVRKLHLDVPTPRRHSEPATIKALSSYMYEYLYYLPTAPANEFPIFPALSATHQQTTIPSLRSRFYHTQCKIWYSSQLIPCMHQSIRQKP